MTRSNQYALPDKSSTRSTAKYLAAWREFAAPIAEAMGGQIVGFDPGIDIQVGRRLYQFDAFVVQRLNDRFAGKPLPELTPEPQELQDPVAEEWARWRKQAQEWAEVTAKEAEELVDGRQIK